MEDVRPAGTVTVFGLGEAGSRIAADLAQHVRVHGFDPAPVDTPDGVIRHDTPDAAVADADLVLAVTAAHDAPTALSQALGHVPTTAVFADLSTSAPAAMRAMASEASEAGLLFADVALMTTVPGRGLRTPQLVSGPGAAAYAARLQGLDVPIEVLTGDAGLAMTHKLLRSVVVKGLGMLLIEAVRAGDAAGLGTWIRDHLADTLEQADGAFAARLVEGMPVHAARRLEEMRAATLLLDDLEVPATITQSVVTALADLHDGAVDAPQLRAEPRT